MIISCVAPSSEVTVKRLQDNYENDIPLKKIIDKIKFEKVLCTGFKSVNPRC